MRPFTIYGGGQPEKGSVILQWLNLVAGDEWTEEGKDKSNITVTRKHCKLRVMINALALVGLASYSPNIQNFKTLLARIICCIDVLSQSKKKAHL